MSEQLNKLKALRVNLRKMVDTLKHYKKLFEADGYISPEEKTALQKMDASIAKINAEIDQREDKLSFGKSISNVGSKTVEAIGDALSRKDDAPHTEAELTQQDIDVTLAAGETTPTEPAPNTTDTTATDDTTTNTDTASNDDTTTDTTDTTSTNDDDASDSSDTTTDHEDVQEPTGSVISKSVGKGGDNIPNDVLIVQKLLRDKWKFDIPQDGECGATTIRAIGQFQFKNVQNMAASQDSKIDAGGNSWKHLIGERTHGFAPTADGTLAGAETEDEKRLAAFAESVGDIQIEVAPGQFVGVRPPYHMNSTKRRVPVNEARANNKGGAIGKIIRNLGINSVGKTTPEEIKLFLETCIKAGHVSDTSSTGMNDFLDEYGITMDCSGLVVQSINYMQDGSNSPEMKDAWTNNIVSYATKVTTPSNLVAGDVMVKNGHVRLIIDVDVEGNELHFTTVESTASKVIGYGGGTGSDGGDGVGQRRFRFKDKSAMSGIEYHNGQNWVASSEEASYQYRRIDAASQAKLNALHN